MSRGVLRGHPHMHRELCGCRAGPHQPLSRLGGPDSLGAEVIGCQACIIDLKHQVGVVNGGRQDLGDMVGLVSKHAWQPWEGLATPL